MSESMIGLCAAALLLMLGANAIDHWRLRRRGQRGDRPARRSFDV